ncbi:MAG: metallophosphoesterase, partial [Oscillospiraceae bacterium]|nr:metallophosphoesterase [Oscillospiraceae bacterium]
MKKKIKWCLILLFTVFVICGLDQRFLIRQYQLQTEKLEYPVRIVLLTDLHSCYYGKNQKNLLEAIDAQHPDIIALCGDIFDDQMSDENTEIVLTAISEKYPCYYVTGNHEGWCTKEKFLNHMQFLQQHQIQTLSGEMKILECNQ